MVRMLPFSSSAKGVRDIYPNADIMLCSGHTGWAHKKMLKKHQKAKSFTDSQIEKYKDTFPNVCNKEYQQCECVGKHSSECGCLSNRFIAKHTPILLPFFLEHPSLVCFVVYQVYRRSSN